MLAKLKLCRACVARFRVGRKCGAQLRSPTVISMMAYSKNIGASIGPRRGDARPPRVWEPGAEKRQESETFVTKQGRTETIAASASVRGLPCVAMLLELDLEVPNVKATVTAAERAGAIEGMTDLALQATRRTLPVP